MESGGSGSGVLFPLCASSASLLSCSVFFYHSTRWKGSSGIHCPSVQGRCLHQPLVSAIGNLPSMPSPVSTFIHSEKPKRKRHKSALFLRHLSAIKHPAEQTATHPKPQSVLTLRCAQTSRQTQNLNRATFIEFCLGLYFERTDEPPPTIQPKHAIRKPLRRRGTSWSRQNINSLHNPFVVPTMNQQF